jgi:GNAT superfamily N-acetyltransferase
MGEIRAGEPFPVAGGRKGQAEATGELAARAVAKGVMTSMPATVPTRGRGAPLFFEPVRESLAALSKVADVIIRVAEATDWPRIWPFFSAIVAAGETYAYPETLTQDSGEPFWMEQPPGLTVVAMDGDELLGSAKMGPNRPGRGAHVATASFMVDPTYQGRGAGRALGRYAVDWARAAGYHSMQFNAVVETNVVALKLWQSLGFQILTTVPEAFDHPSRGLVGLHVMYQRL